ncbi:MAG: S8 family serine peptidase [Polyangia bacterium]
MDAVGFKIERSVLASFRFSKLPRKRVCVGTGSRNIFLGIALMAMSQSVASCVGPNGKAATGVGSRVESHRLALSTDSSSLQQKATSAAAAQLGVAPTAVVLGPPVTLDLPLTGRHFTQFKAVGGSVTTVGVSFDELGQPANVEPALAAESAAYKKLYGKKTPGLYGQMVAAQPATQRVSFLLNFNDTTARGESVSISSTMSPAAVQALPDNTNSLRLSYAAATASVRARFLAKVQQFDSGALDGGPDPVVYATLSPSEIAEMESDPDVQSIERGDLVPKQELNVCSLELGYWDPGQIYPGSDLLYVNGVGIDGTGVKIGELDPFALVTTQNPALSNVLQYLPWACYNSSGDVDHATAVAGVLKSSDSWFHGLAPNAALFVGGGCGALGDLEQSLSGAINWGATTVNASWGGGGLTDDYEYDSAVFSSNVLPAVSAGNSGGTGCPDGSGGYVTTPGNAYNVLTAGAYSTYGTPNYPNDDSMYVCSAWQTPSLHGDRIKPEIIAPGVGVMTLGLDTGNYPRIEPETGTSIAAPMITGTIALIQQANPGLKAWPNLVKAIILASAQYDLPNIPQGTKGTGYGRLHTDTAVRMASNTVSAGQYWWTGQGGLYCSLFPLYYSYIYLVAGKPARVALVWDNDPVYTASSMSEPSSDLDLFVYGPAPYGAQTPYGSRVGYSGSWDNTQEVANFTPPTSGYYQAVANVYRCSMPVNRIAIAAYQAP